MSALSFSKSERICNKYDIDLLFSRAAGSVREGSMALRYAFRESVINEVSQKVLIVVPKKRVRKAVDRNRLKRQIKEIYRLNKGEHRIDLGLRKTLLIAIIYNGKPELKYSELEKVYLLAMTKLNRELTRSTG